jgi:hypothetical protein
MQRQNDVIRNLIAPAVERLSRGVRVMHDSVIEMQLCGGMYCVIGDMQLRQELLSLANHKAPMLPPLTPARAAAVFDDDFIASPYCRSLVAHFSLLDAACDVVDKQQHGRIGLARDCMRAANISSSTGNVVRSALADGAFALFRTIGVELIPPE